MAGFFKQWAANASEYKRLQQDLTVIFARSGVNFMLLHPAITKVLVGLSREEGAAEAVAKFNETKEMVTTMFPDATQEQVQQEMLRIFNSIDRLAR